MLNRHSIDCDFLLPKFEKHWKPHINRSPSDSNSSCGWILVISISFSDGKVYMGYSETPLLRKQNTSEYHWLLGERDGTCSRLEMERGGQEI